MTDYFLYVFLFCGKYIQDSTLLRSLLILTFWVLLVKSINDSISNSVNQIKQSAQKSIYNATIVQSFDNNSLTKLENQNTLDKFVYKMKNILDIDLFK